MAMRSGPTRLAMRPRQPWLAALASLVLPGFGQLYNGDLNRAIWLFLSFALLCVPALALDALYLPARLMLPCLLLGLALAVWGYAVWDAWQVQWQTDTAQVVDADTPSAKTPPLNRAQIAPATELQLTVPDGQVFVLGDNRLRSVDSRSFGTVPMQDILGKARQVWFSSDAQGVRWNRLGLVLE